MYVCMYVCMCVGRAGDRWWVGRKKDGRRGRSEYLNEPCMYDVTCTTQAYVRGSTDNIGVCIVDLHQD